MKSITDHIIHKQTIDIRFSDFTTAHSWDAAKQVETVEAVRMSIEKCFGNYDAVKEYLTINKLELDLGVFSADQLSSKMPEKLYLELQKILSSSGLNRNVFEEGETREDGSSINIGSTPLVKNSEVTAFLFFLHHGYLPWWYSNEPDWKPQWLLEFTGENWRELRYFLRIYQEDEVHNEHALLRLISQFSDGFLAALLKGFQLKEPVEKAWSWLKLVYEALQKTEAGSLPGESALPSLSVLRRHFWRSWISHAVGRSAIPELASLLFLIKEPSLITHFLSGEAENREWMNSIPECWHAEVISLKQEGFKFKPEVNPGRESVTHTKSEKFKRPEKEDFIHIPDSGLVLLYPFLPRFFKFCNWLHENEFLSDEARNRAVSALHYLGCGDEEVPEYVLMLPKLLCGIPPEWPLEPGQPLSNAERAACDDLLVQVIGHWSALGNTSPAALRETFLRREGELFSTDDGWRLEVHRKTEDILLNRLPWGFSMIKFSWMPRLLTVSWE